MPFVTSFERYARQEGRQEGLQTGLRALKEAIHEVVLVRFSEVPPELEQRLESCDDTDQLQA